MAVLVGTVKAYGYTETEQAVITSVQPSVAIAKTVSSETGSIQPLSGQHSGLSASFSLKTNGTDDDYEFILGSTITTIDGEVSAYTETGALLFANTTSLPSTSAVENAKIGGNDNRNVIAYPLTMTITEPMAVSYSEDKTVDNGVGCYLIKVNAGAEGILTQIVGQSPLANSYSIGQDESGSYKSTVYFTAVSK